jgi:transcriptional regulator with XRE-family HTH domain
MQTWLVLALDRSVIIGGDTEIGVLDAFLIVDGVRFTLGAIGEGEPTLFREVLRLRHALGVSERQIAVTTGLSRSTVSEYLRRAAVIGITWPVPDGLDDAELERRLFTPPTFDEKPARPLPDWSHVHKELKRPAVTLLLLWEEYRAEHSDGYGYSRFCELRWSSGVRGERCC